MELAVQPEAQQVWEGGPMCGSCAELRRELIEARQAAHYWRSMHARAKERVAKWQSQCRQTEGQLAAAQQRIEQMDQRVRELERETAGLRQRNEELLKAPFGKRSEKRQGGSDSGQGQPGTGSGDMGSADTGGEQQKRSRGGQPGADAQPRADRSGLLNSGVFRRQIFGLFRQQEGAVFRIISDV